ncbi:MAG: AMP-binding protein [Promethearchaeota archaeon]
MVKWENRPKIDEPWLKYWPEDTPREIDYDEITIDNIIRTNAKLYPDQKGFYFMGKTATFKELDEMIDRFASGLSKIGVKKGDVILIDIPNSPQFVITYYAILRIGAIANPIIPLNRYAEIVHQVNDSKGKILIILDSLYEEYLHGKDLSKMPTLEKIVLTGLGEYMPSMLRVLGTLLGKIPRMKKWPEKVGDIEFLKFQDLVNSEIDLPDVKIDVMNDTAVLIYTGGTTGAPKGVMLTHFNVVANCIQGFTWVTTQIPELKDTIGKGGMVAVLPLAHSFAMTIAMNLGYYCGYELILFPRPPDDLTEILKVIIKENATFMPGVPTLFNKMNLNPKTPKYKEKMKNSGFYACLSAAAPLPLEVKLKFEELTGSRVVEGYGMSEASPMLTANPFNRSRENTVGFPVPDTFLKIMDAEKGEKYLGSCPHSGKYCAEKCGSDGEEKYIGEICGSGPQIMKGYLNKPEANARVLRKDEDGVIWYYTSDIGCIDAEGYLHIKDRKRDMIKYKGHSVFPREVEDLMYQYEPINEVAVYGLKDPDPEIGEQIYATVTLKPEYEGKITVDDIKKWVKENIAPYKYPRKIKIIKEMPKSLVGKVLRRVLRDEEEKSQKQE